MSFAVRRAADDQAPAPPGFSLARGALHEFYAGAEADGVSLAALAMMLGDAGRKQIKLWVRHEVLASETGVPHPAGLAELGLDPAGLLLVRARDVPSALQAALEGVRGSGLAAVIVELWGETRSYDLVASRRLALAAQASGVPAFVLRIGASPVPSAAQTRWRVRAWPSQALPAKAPGAPAFELTLMRARHGQEGLRYHLEWDRDAKGFISHEPGRGEQSAPGIPHRIAGYAPLSGPVVPVPFDRSHPARDEPEPARRAG